MQHPHTTRVMPSSESTYLVLDIETVPDRELFTPPEPRAGVERPFPPLYACRPDRHRRDVAGRGRCAFKRIGTIGEGKDEAGMMADFADFMGKWRPHVVTWNGRGFDLPVLALRALRHGLDFRWYYRGEGYRYRYSEEGHLDLCDVLADHGAARMTSLDGAARLIGLPGQGRRRRQPGRGPLHAGQIEALRHYCLSDVAQTAFLFLRYRLVAGRSIATSTGGRQRRCSAALEADGRFGRCSERRRPRAGCCSRD